MDNKIKSTCEVPKNWKYGKTSGQINKRLIVSEDNQTIVWIGHGNDEMAEAIAEYILNMGPYEPTIDFNKPENVFIEVIEVDSRPYQCYDGWQTHQIESYMIMDDPEEISHLMGAARYDKEFGNFLNYTLESIIECPGKGFFVVEGITGFYHKGDGWTTDDNLEVYFESVRPATQEEIDEYSESK